MSTLFQKISISFNLGYNAEYKATQIRAYQLYKCFNALRSDKAWEKYKLACQKPSILFRKHLRRHIKNLENQHVTPQNQCKKLLNRYKTKPQD